MSRTALKDSTRRRTAPKAERQQQLIDATIRSVARHGLSDTTTATVAREAGLSVGIINLHFQSKDRLLMETLRYLSEQYREAWEKAVAKAGDSPADKLAAMVAVDFRPPLCNRDQLAVWFAFWGESKSRPTYRKLCAERDRAYRAEMEQACRELVEEGGYETIDATTAAAALSAMTSGLWLDLLTSPRSVSRKRALEICRKYLATTFPRHFH
ncbi:MAG: transcriptional regulator BetI [Xanthomonadales bacterium]|nr:transcriptional regulator BetI [Xanthomonadales bacterium]